MSRLLPLLVLVAACGGGQKAKVEDTTPQDVGATREACCCKYLEYGNDDDGPTLEPLTTLQCSQLHGECVDDVQCPEGAGESGSDGSSSESSSSDSPGSDGAPLE